MAHRPQPRLIRTVFKNAVAITLGSLALKVINLLFGVFVVRQLGDDRFGQYAIVLAFVGLFQIFAELGMSQYVMREIARDHSRAAALFWNLVALRLLLAAGGMLGIPLLASATGYTPELVAGIFVYTSGFLLSAFQAPLDMVLAAHERLDIVVAQGVVAQLIVVILGVIFLAGGLGFIWLIVAGHLSLLPQIGIALWAIRRQRLAVLPFQVSPRAWPGLIRAGLPFGVISLALTIAFSIDTVMMSWFEPEQVVGWYNAGYGLAKSLLFFFTGFSVAIVPSLAKTYVQDRAEVERWYYRSVKFIALGSLPLAVGGMLLAFPLIRFLYTGEFLPAAVGLQILIWDVPLLMFTSFCGNMTTIIGEERAAARIYTINAVANVALNLYAIPRFGLVGAALVTAVTDLIGTLQFHFLLKRKLNLPNLAPALARVLIAAGLMGAAVAALHELHLFASIGLGAALYTALALALRVLDEEERAAILRLLRLRPRASPAKEAVP